LYQQISSFQDKNKRPLAHLNKGPLTIYYYENRRQVQNSCKELFTGVTFYLLGIIRAMFWVDFTDTKISNRIGSL